MPFPVPSRIAEALRQCTIEVRSDSPGDGGVGSGVVLTEGRVVTNAHVLHGSRWSSQLCVEWDGARLPATVLKRDSARDLGLLAVQRLGAPPAILAMEPARAGQPVIAAGNPMGFAGAISSGMVLGVSALRGLGSATWIQADVRLAPGNSGGPLADLHGHVLGINTMVAGGMALAIPIQTVQAFLTQSGQRRELGVVVRPVRHRSNSPRPAVGLLLLEVADGGAADLASLLPGDLLVGANGRPLQGPDDLTTALAAGDSVALDFYRGGVSQLRHVTAQLPPLVIPGRQAVNAA